MTAPGSLVLVTGASGYIGGRLVGELLAAGYRVRCLARTPAKLDAAPWRAEVEVVKGDIEGDLADAVDGVGAVYYLVHSIVEGDDWTAREAAAAANLRDAAAAADVERIVYLGGLGADDPSSGSELSPHLRSRHRVGEVLADGPIPVTELRAAVIIGSGSASFEMLRYLVEVLPVMVTPKWVDTRCQPIAVRDVLRYLVQVLSVDETTGSVLEIGGPDVLTYREMMAVYAEEAGLRPRIVIPVPVLTPRLSSLWVGLVTPLPRSLARPLVSSLVNEVTVKDAAILESCPGPRIGHAESVRLALRRVEAHDVTTSWSGAAMSAVAGPLPTDPEWSGGAVLQDVRERLVRAPAGVVHRTICGVGGTRGWYSGEWLWDLRGVFDKIVGGPGMRRGRRDPDRLSVGDAVDFWRVETIEPDRLLRLRAEMRLPGVAAIEWRIEPVADTGGVPRCRLVQTATFVPRGLWGRAYWYGVAPFHGLVFPGLVDGLAHEAERAAQAELTAAQAV
ncbi:MAG: SDR family oxidoreductase [Ilumatobacteraceae bacterium]